MKRDKDDLFVRLHLSTRNAQCLEDINRARRQQNQDS